MDKLNIARQLFVINKNILNQKTIIFFLKNTNLILICLFNQLAFMTILYPLIASRVVYKSNFYYAARKIDKSLF